MLKPLLLALLVFVAGSASTTKLRARQELTLLAKLPEDQAERYWALLRRRFRRYQLLRGVAVIALAVLFFTIAKSRTLGSHAPHPAADPSPGTASPAAR